MNLDLKANLGYNPTMGALMDAIEQAHLAGFDARDCRIAFSIDGGSRVYLTVSRDTEGGE